MHLERMILKGIADMYLAFSKQSIGGFALTKFQRLELELVLVGAYTLMKITCFA